MSLAWQSVPHLPSDCHSVVIANQSADWCGNPFSPRHRRVTLFYVLPPAGYFCLQRQKYPKRRLKLRFKTSLARYARAGFVSYFLAQSVFPCTAVGQKDCAPTAFRYRFAAAAPCHGSSFPLYHRNLERISPFRHAALVRTVIPSQPADWHRNPSLLKPPLGALYIVAARCAAPTPAAAGAAAGARFDNRHTPQGESFQRERARTPFPFGRFKGIGFLREGGNSESPFP